MAFDRAYRRLYATLVRLYPKPYRERFGEGMEQTFNDLCRERRNELSPAFVLRTFGDAAIGIVREHCVSFSSLPMTKSILRLAIGTVLLLLIPFALTIRDGGVEGVGWNWTMPGDYLFAFTVIFGIGLAFLLVARRSANLLYKLAVGLGLAGAFFLIWVTAAVQVIGDENPANLLYGIVLLIGFFGALLSRFEARKMSYVLLAAAIAQLAVPAVGLVIWSPADWSWAPGVLPVFVLNAGFAAFFLGSALLFRLAAAKNAPAVAA